MDEWLAASGECIEQRDDGALVVGACGIDDDIGRLRGAGENFRVIQRAHHRLDAEGTNGVCLFA